MKASITAQAAKKAQRAKRSSDAAVEQCSGCGAAVALRPPSVGAAVCAWCCEKCGAVYFGADVQSAADGFSGLVRAPNALFCRPPKKKIETSAKNADQGPPEHVQRLLKCLAGKEYTGPERRRGKHYQVTRPAVVIPLAADFRVDGPPMEMTTLNVSLYGAALLHTRHTSAPYLALDFTMDGNCLLQTVMRVLRVRSMGLGYEVAGEFVSGLTQA
jgi:hypothetical protein